MLMCVGVGGWVGVGVGAWVHVVWLQMLVHLCTHHLHGCAVCLLRNSSSWVRMVV